MEEAESVMMYTWSEQNGGVIMDPLRYDKHTLSRKCPVRIELLS